MMGTRDEVRSELAALFSIESEFNVVNAYPPLDLKGATNVLNIYSKRTRHEFISKHLNNHFYTFTLHFLTAREDPTDPALDLSAAAETALDAAAEAIRRVIRANISDPFWSDINLDAESEAGFATIKSTLHYREEFYTVTVKVTGD